MAWQIDPSLTVAVAAMGILACFAALDLVRRVPLHAGPATTRAPWLAGSALALGTGIWSIHFIGMAGEPLPIGIGYGGWLTLAGWAAAVLASALSLGMAYGWSGGPARLVTAGLVLGLGTLATETLCVLDMRLSPGVAWEPGALAAALAAAGAGACTAYFLNIRPAGAGQAPATSADNGTATRLRTSVPLQPSKGAQVRQALAAVTMGLGLAAAHRLAIWGVQVPLEATSLNHMTGTGSGTLALLASLGSSVLLAVLLLLSIIESRMQLALHEAIGRIDDAARTDALTGLPNRMTFDQCLDAAVQAADHQGGSRALLFIGIDGFKPVNDCFGRGVGDLLLRDMAERLRRVARAGDVVARVGGDEFVLLIGGPAGTAEASDTARRILTAVGEPCDLEGRQTVMTCSVGIVLYPQQSAQPTAMMHAEAAARAVKRTGGGSYAFFEPHMVGGAREQLELLRDLRLAVAGRQLELFYQPKVHAPSGEITGAEALMRWHHPQRGMVSPASFIPVAERYGLINELGNWLIEDACRQIRAWRDHGLRMRVAINLSMHQLRQEDLVPRIRDALERYRIEPKQLTCEITESAAMNDTRATLKVIAELSAAGVHLSIDDFGTGYSSLAYLRKLQVEELKIDRSFVLDLESSEDARAVVDAVVQLAKALGLKVVAEGVETVAQQNLLRAMGCDELQGYLFAKPMSAAALLLWAMNDDGPSPLDFRDSLFSDTLPAQFAATV